MSTNFRFCRFCLLVQLIIFVPFSFLYANPQGRFTPFYSPDGDGSGGGHSPDSDASGRSSVLEKLAKMSYGYGYPVSKYSEKKTTRDSAGTEVSEERRVDFSCPPQTEVATPLTRMYNNTKQNGNSLRNNINKIPPPIIVLVTQPTPLPPAPSNDTMPKGEWLPFITTLITLIVVCLQQIWKSK